MTAQSTASIAAAGGRRNSLGDVALRRLKNKMRSWRRPETVAIDGVALRMRYDQWSPEMVSRLLTHRYEAEERALIPQVVKPGDRVLEIGGAIGLISLLCARICGADNIFVYEANPDVLAAAQANYVENDAAISALHGAVVGDDFAGDGVEFFVHPNFWSSSLQDRQGAIRIEAPAFRIGDVIRRHRPTVLVMDVEGAEHAILMNADLSSLSKLCIEFHTRYMGRPEANALIKRLFDQGFLIDLELSKGETLFFERQA